jgi:hypothetical protein
MREPCNSGKVAVTQQQGAIDQSTAATVDQSS